MIRAQDLVNKADLHRMRENLEMQFNSEFTALGRLLAASEEKFSHSMSRLEVQPQRRSLDGRSVSQLQDIDGVRASLETRFTSEFNSLSSRITLTEDKINRSRDADSRQQEAHGIVQSRMDEFTRRLAEQVARLECQSKANARLDLRIDEVSRGFADQVERVKSESKARVASEMGAVSEVSSMRSRLELAEASFAQGLSRLETRIEAAEEQFVQQRVAQESLRALIDVVSNSSVEVGAQLESEKEAREIRSAQDSQRLRDREQESYRHREDIKCLTSTNKVHADFVKAVTLELHTIRDGLQDVKASSRKAASSLLESFVSSFSAGLEARKGGAKAEHQASGLDTDGERLAMLFLGQLRRETDGVHIRSTKVCNALRSELAASYDALGADVSEKNSVILSSLARLEMLERTFLTLASEVQLKADSHNIAGLVHELESQVWPWRSARHWANEGARPESPSPRGMLPLTAAPHSARPKSSRPRPVSASASRPTSASSKNRHQVCCCQGARGAAPQLPMQLPPQRPIQAPWDPRTVTPPAATPR